MNRKWLAAVVALCAVLAFCAVRVTAQDLLHLQAGTFCRLGDLLGERPGLRAAAVTLIPDGTVLWLDGGLLEPYRPISVNDVARVFLFSTEKGEMGVTLCVDVPVKTPQIRIRSVNPEFLSQNGE